MTEELTAESKYPWEEIITNAIVLDLYDEVITKYGGKKSGPADNCIEGCLGNAWNAEQYADSGGLQGGSIFAIHLMIYIARNHCFADGNKRVAWASFCFVLNYYGLTIEATAKEVQSMVIAIVEKKIDNEGFTVWVRDRLVLRCITQDFI